MAKLYFKYGAMGSSKTATALITKYNYEERGMKVWLIKPSADKRDGQFILTSRIGLPSECEAIPPATDIRALYAARRKALSGQLGPYLIRLSPAAAQALARRNRPVECDVYALGVPGRHVKAYDIEPIDPAAVPKGAVRLAERIDT